MKLIEGMKQLKQLEKKIKQNAERILEYAALPSTRKPQFGTDEEQKKQIQSLIQSNTDMAAEYLKIKKQVDYTNIKTKVQIGKDTFSISDLLQIKRSLGKFMELTYMALSDKQAESQVTMMRTKETSAHVERYYNESDKHAGIQYWQGLQDEIEMRIETINATTDLLEV